MERNLEIDYLRAYAVIFVVVLHMTIELSVSYGVTLSFPRFLSLDSGVDIFFAISGYVICEAYHHLKAKFSGFNLYVNFILRRFKRLWPASTFWLSVCLVLSFLGGCFPIFDDVVMKFFSGLIYLFNFHEFDKRSNLGFFWSLSVEWQFYLIMPVLMCFQRKLRVIILSVLFVFFIFYRPGGDGWWMFRFDGILCGMLAWELSQVYSLRINFTHSTRFFSFFVTVFILVEILLMENLVSGFYFFKSIQCFLAGGLVYLAAQGKGYITDFGCKKIVNWVGLRSYSIYLCHIPILLSISSLKLTGLSAIGLSNSIILALTSMFVFSELSYKFVEPAFKKIVFSIVVVKN